jgi:hypothetical protein
MFGFLATLFHHTEPPAGPFPERDLNRYLDLTVDTIDPRLRSVPGYKRKLRPALSASLSYVNDLIEAIPGPVEVCRQTFSRDPQVRAFFVSVDHMREVFSNCKEVRDFFKDPMHAGEDACYAFLVMNRHERHTLGIDLEGDYLRRDVQQTQVSFTNHRVVKPADSEGKVRRDLCERALENIVGEALGRIAAIQTRRAELAARRTQLRIKRKQRQIHFRALDALLTGGCESDTECRALDAELADVEQALRASAGHLATLNDTVEQLCDVLTHPSDYCRLDRRSLCVDNVGVKVDNGSSRAGHEVHFADIHVGPVERAGVLVKYPRAELLPEGDSLRLADAWLGA